MAANVTSGNDQRRNNGDKVAGMVTAGRVALGVIAAGVGWLGLYRPWHLRWGATPEEATRRLPGDDVVPAPTFNATRAVTVQARPEAIWPWIVQIGFGRAGWYTYDILDNLDRRSADRIIPELQHIAVDDLVPMGLGEDAACGSRHLNRTGGSCGQTPTS